MIDLLLCVFIYLVGSLIALLVAWLFGLLVDFLVGWLIVWVGGLAGWSVGRLVCLFFFRHNIFVCLFVCLFCLVGWSGGWLVECLLVWLVGQFLS